MLKRYFSILIGLIIALAGCQGKLPSRIKTPEDLKLLANYTELSPMFASGAEYMDSIMSDIKGYTIYRYLGVKLFRWRGTLIVKTNGQGEIIRYDWYLDNVKDWINPFPEQVTFGMKDREFAEEIATPVEVSSFTMFEDSVISVYGYPNVKVDSSIKGRTWTDKHASIVFDAEKGFLKLSVVAKNNPLTDSEYWMFSKPHSDSSLAQLELSQTPEYASKRLGLDLSVMERDTAGRGYILKANYNAWGIPGKLSLQFNEDNHLILCQWNFYRDKWNSLERIHYSCLEDLEKSLGEFHAYPSTGTKKNLLEIAFYKVFTDRTYTLRLLANNTLVLDILDSKIFPPPSYMKK